MSALLLLAIFLAAGSVLAVPPDSPYAPGETLDPACAPGEPNCTVSTISPWGSITGTLSNQTDLQSALDAKASTTANISGFTNDIGYQTAANVSTYVTGLPISTFTNDAGFITNSSLSGYVPYTGATGNVNLGANNLTTSGTLSAANLSGVNTGDLTLSDVTGLSLSGQVLSVTSGYAIPLTASTTNWNSFLDTPSTRISAGTGLSWSGNTLNATGGAGSVTSVDASGGATGLSFSGGPITTSGTLTLSGILGVGSGGTGTSTAPSFGQVLLGNNSGGYDLVATSSLGFSGGPIFADSPLTGDGTSGNHLTIPGLFINVPNNVYGIGDSANTLVGNTGTDVNALGPLAAQSNIGNDVNAFGGNAAYQNIGANVNALGNNAGNGNTSGDVNAFGSSAGQGNSGTSLNALGSGAGQGNSGGNVNAFGSAAANGNTANNLNAFGSGAGLSNTGTDVNAFGQSAGFSNTGTNSNFMGNLAGIGNSGNNVNAFGNGALNSNTGNDIVAIGNGAGSFNTYNNLALFGIGATASSSNQAQLGTDSNPLDTYIHGNLSFTGGLYDSASSLGTSGYVLSSTGSQVQWVATSTLGLGGSSGTVSSVDASGGTTGLTFSGGPITTSGTLTLGGVLGTANGGTGTSTTANNSIFVTNGSGTPSWRTTLPAFTLGGTVTGNSQNLTGLNQLTVTGATATSTFSTGGFTIGGNQFVVQQTSGNIGIGTSVPGSRFHVLSSFGNSSNSIFTTNDFVSGSTGSDLSISFGATSGNTSSVLTAATAGGSLFGAMEFDASKFAFMNGNVGVGTTTPATKLHILGTTEQLRLGYDASDYASFTVGSDGAFSITPTNSATTTVTNALVASNLSGTNTGNVTLTGENYLSLSGQQITASAINLSGSNVTGTLAVNKGGTGTTTFGGANTLLYTTAADALSSIATGNNGVLITSSGGVPSISSTLPAAVQGNITSLGTLTSGVWNGSAIGPTYGGTGLTSYATGDLIYASGSNTLANRIIGNAGDVLSVSGGVPTWMATSTLGIISSQWITNGPDIYFNTGNAGIGIASPSAKLDILGATEQLRLRYDTSDYSSLTVDSGGGLTISGSGANSGKLSAGIFAATSSTTPSTFNDVTLGSQVEGDAPVQFGIDGNAWTIGYLSADKSFRIASSTTLTSNVALAVLKGGLVGIGTVAPTQTLTVQGGVCVTAGNACPSEVSGKIVAQGLIVQSAFDLAENYPTADETLSAGEIVSLDPANPGFILRAEQSTMTPLLGIVSTAPGLTLGDSAKSKPIALSGRVPVKVNLEGGAIAVGDRIALSSVPGVGKKAALAEESVGIALSALSSPNGTVVVFVQSREAASPSISSPGAETVSSLFSTLAQPVAAAFRSLGVALTDTVTYFKNLVVEKITALTGVFESVDTYNAHIKNDLEVGGNVQAGGNVSIDGGLQLKDEATGETYCVKIRNGDWNKEKGLCTAATSTPVLATPLVEAQTPTPSPSPAPSSGVGAEAPAPAVSPEATSTPDASPAPSATSSPTPSASPASDISPSPTPSPTSPEPSPEITSSPAPEATTTPSPEVAPPPDEPAATPTPAQDSAPTSDEPPATP
ncbi:MAG: hypothetical protein PHS53_00305 [Candidatus Pacebacteria bacterium]|nr:hypothetical protein [Candidatus Paceibacterota bacterium]